MQNLTDYDYELPEALIAQAPSAQRSHSRLLVLDKEKSLHDQYFHQLEQWLQAGDLIVLNDSAVIKATFTPWTSPSSTKGCLLPGWDTPLVRMD